MRYAFLILALVAPFLFPWPLSVLLALAAAVPFPLAPLAAGLLADALYLPPATLPIATLLGAFATLAALLMRRSFKAGMMRG